MEEKETLPELRNADLSEEFGNFGTEQDGSKNSEVLQFLFSGWCIYKSRIRLWKK